MISFKGARFPTEVTLHYAVSYRHLGRSGAPFSIMRF
jgi:hypothetical protein